MIEKSSEVNFLHTHTICLIINNPTNVGLLYIVLYDIIADIFTPLHI